MDRTKNIFVVLGIFTLTGCTIYRPLYNGSLHSEWYVKRGSSEKCRQVLCSISSERVNAVPGLTEDFKTKDLTADMAGTFENVRISIAPSEISDNPPSLVHSEKIPGIRENTRKTIEPLTRGERSDFFVPSGRKMVEQPFPNSFPGRLVEKDVLPVHSLSRLSLILGIIGLILPLVGLPLSTMALVFGIRGLIQTIRHSDEYRGRGMAIAGIVTGGAGIILGLILITLILYALATFPLLWY